MDEKLSKALDFGNFSTTLDNQRRMLKEKFITDTLHFTNGGQFSIDKELVNYVNLLVQTGQDSTVITDDNDTPVQIDNVENFYSDISSKYFSALNEYHSEYSKLEKQRSIDGLVE